MKPGFQLRPGAVRLGDELSAVGLYFRRINFGMVRRQTGAQAAINSFRRAVQRVGTGTAVASHFDMFVVYRIVGGVGIGLASALSPLYIAEVSPAEKRGRFVAVNQLTIVIGVLAAQLINLMIAEPVEPGATQQMIVDSWNGQMGWRWMFGAELVPALAFLVLMFLSPSRRAGS